MALFGGKKRAYAKAPTSAHKTKSTKSTQVSNNRRISGCLAVLFYVFAIALAGITLSSCSWSSSFSKSLYVAEIRRNSTQAMGEIHFGIGYFGGCVTTTRGVSNASDVDSEIHCIMNMYAYDENDLLEELVEEFDSSTSAVITGFLNETLPQARHLQKDVFHFAAPVIQLVLLVLGGAMLFTACTNVAPKRSYRYLLVLAFLFIVFSMGLMFSTAFGSLQALHGLVNEQDSELPNWTMNDTGDSIHFADGIYKLQVAQAVTVILFAICMGLMFAGGLRPKRTGAV